MIPLFHTGDVLLVSLDAPIERDRVVLARMPDGGYAAKQVGRLTRTRLELISLNPDFAPVVVPRDERTVIGTVVLRWCEHQGCGRVAKG
jgi:phage repressor protein C with HTH and peptisase S24 domain